MTQHPSPDFARLKGPFDIIGDVHGCIDELRQLLAHLGYGVTFDGTGEARRVEVIPPAGRMLIFVGDLVDRGPGSPDVLRIAMTMLAAGTGLAVPGNHDNKFLRWLEGHKVKMTHGLDETVRQMNAEPQALKEAARRFFERLPFHLVLAGGDLVVAHAGIKSHMIGHASGAIREFCLYGDHDGVDADGMPRRHDWGADYSGRAAVVYGHTPVETPMWVNNTMCIDTGCCFGNRLTALRWPEREIVSVPAARAYVGLRRPLGLPPRRR